MKTNKIISTCLYSNDGFIHHKYLTGLSANAIEYKKYYPDFEFWCFIEENLLQLPEVKFASDLGVIFISVGKGTEMKNYHETMWRFFACCYADIVIVRDLDSRFSERELHAVNEWLNSDKSLHIMRDHNLHNHRIMAGMWGVKNKSLKDIDILLSKYNKSLEYDQRFIWGIDQRFLSDIVYLKFFGNILIHDRTNHFQDENVKNFSSELLDLNFVGQSYDEHNFCRYGL